MMHTIMAFVYSIISSEFSLKLLIIFQNQVTHQRLHKNHFQEKRQALTQ